MHLVIATILVLLSAMGVEAQSIADKRRQFLDQIDKSYQLTKASSHRRTVKVETSDYPDKAWEAYSSWVEEVVFPDRSFLSYKTHNQRELICIGRTHYSREQSSSSWTLDEQKSQCYVSSPSGPFGFGEISATRIDSGNINWTVWQVVKVRPKTSPTDDERDKDTFNYWFDDKGILVRNQSIGFNGYRFVRRNEAYEYDNNIKIEAPIK